MSGVTNQAAGDHDVAADGTGPSRPDVERDRGDAGAPMERPMSSGPSPNLTPYRHSKFATKLADSRN